MARQVSTKYLKYGIFCFMISKGEVLYFNGLERTKVGVPERALSLYLRLRGIRSEHAEVNWHSEESFQEIFDSASELAEQKLRQSGHLAIVGASAGGSLGVNVFQRLRVNNPGLDLSLITFSAWLNAADLQRLEYTAVHRPGKQKSEAFRDSVIHCSEVAVPLLTEADKARIVTTYPSTDETVPLDVMGIEGVEAHVIPARGHVPGIALASLMLPHLIDELHDHSQG